MARPTIPPVHSQPRSGHQRTDALLCPSSAKAVTLERVFRWHITSLVAMARRYVESTDLAEEAVQEAFLRAWTSRDRWATGDQLTGYLYVVARHRALDMLRRQKSEARWASSAGRPRPNDLPAHDLPDATLQAAELAELIDRTIADLPPRRRLIFQLRQRGLSNGEIAAQLSISVKTIEVQITHALRALRGRLEEWYELRAI